MGKICVLRIGHRIGRDQRITTHVFLVARAFGAEEGILCGDEDDSVLRGIARVSDLWGGKFGVKYEKSWKSFLKKRKDDGWKVAHLTMYGEEMVNFEKVKKENGNCVVVVGAGKVPTELYHMADLNLSVTNQPHSEVAALAIFLDRYFGGKEMLKKFDGKLQITPNTCGKVVVHGENR